MTRTARYGAAWLLGMGVLVSGFVVHGFVTSRWACDAETGYSFACDVSNVAVAIGAIPAALHLVAGVSLWRGQLRGVVAGVVIAPLGLLISLGLLSNEPWWPVLPAAVGYLGTSLVLAYAVMDWRAHRRHAAQP